MQKKKMQSKRIQRKRNLNVKIILNVNCYNVSKIKKSVLPNITLNVYSERIWLSICNVLRHKCLLYGATHLYSFIVTEKL